MKRKLDLTNYGNPSEKMIKFNTTELEKMNISEINASSSGGERMFNFKLTDKTARKNLLKSAQRTFLETETSRDQEKSRYENFCEDYCEHMLKWYSIRKKIKFRRK